MTSYILSVLGIVIAGVFIDVILPSGSISKYIKGIYSIFVVAVLISPITKLLDKDFKFNYTQIQTDEKLLTYIYNNRTSAQEIEIEQYFEQEGFKGIDICFKYSIENDMIKYNACEINLKNLAINADKQHINKYEFIKSTIINATNLTEEEIKIYE